MTRNTEPLSIEKVKELLKGITPGPWNVQGAAIQGNRLICAPALNDIAIAQTVPRPWSIAAECADAKLMAAAPDLARLCLSLAAQLQQEREARADDLRRIQEWAVSERREAWDYEEGNIPPTHPHRKGAALNHLVGWISRLLARAAQPAEAGEG